MQAVRVCWTTRCEECLPHEVLQVALRLESITQATIKECLSFVRAGVINGRSAIYCISEIKQFMHGSFTKADDVDELDESPVEFLGDLFHLCVEPFLTDAPFQSLSSCPTSSSHSNSSNSHCAIFLELIPSIFSCLTAMDGRPDRDESLTVIRKLIDYLLLSEWRNENLVLLLSLMPEWPMPLRPSHFRKLQSRILTYSKVTKEAAEIAGVMRVCLRFFELCKDPAWVHTLRIIYRRSQSSAMQSVEMILEQYLSQTISLNSFRYTRNVW